MMRGHVSDVTVILLANQRSPQLLMVLVDSNFLFRFRFIIHGSQ